MNKLRVDRCPLQLGNIHILRNQSGWVGGVGQMIMFYAKKAWFTNEM